MPAKTTTGWLRPVMSPQQFLKQKPDNQSASWQRLAEMRDDRGGRFKHERLGRCRLPIRQRYQITAIAFLVSSVIISLTLETAATNVFTGNYLSLARVDRH